MLRKQYLCACAFSALALGLAVPASAQVADSGDLVEDIIVTAQGRAQVLADVPLAISAVTADTLQNSGANDIRQLNQVAPSLLVSSTGNEANGSARRFGYESVLIKTRNIERGVP